VLQILQGAKRIVYERAPELFPCPSKFFYQRYLRRQIGTTDNSPNIVVLDIRCADLKYRRLFGYRKYFGIDRDKHAMSSGANKWSGQFESSLIAMDVRELPQYVPLADLVVCGHTMAHLTSDERR
jgi:hypothetical protein